MELVKSMEFLMSSIHNSTGKNKMIIRAVPFISEFNNNTAHQIIQNGCNRVCTKPRETC